MSDELTRRWQAMCLRMLAQVLVKVHAGPRWGFSEETVLQMMKDADALALELDGTGLEPRTPPTETRGDRDE